MSGAPVTATLRKISNTDADRDLLSQAVEVVRGGGIVAFPTETVYALAVAADSTDAIERLRRAKGREGQKPFQILVSGIADVEARVSPLPGRARILMERFWPGPLTVVVRTSDGGTIGFRAPAHPIAQAVLRLAGGALVATSANRSGAEPLACGEEILQQFAEDVDLILEGEPRPARTASTVVLLDDDELSILREGAISHEDLRNALRNGDEDA